MMNKALDAFFTAIGIVFAVCGTVLLLSFLCSVIDTFFVSLTVL